MHGMNRTDLRWTGVTALLAFGPLTLLGYVLVNPHGSGNLAAYAIGVGLLFPTFLLSTVFDVYLKNGSAIGLGIAQFVWIWFLILVLRVAHGAMLPGWQRLIAYVRASTARKIATLVVVGSLFIGAVFPVESVTVPQWRVQFVDRAGNPLKNIPVRQVWVDSGIESSAASREEDTTTNELGYVEFPERRLRTVFIAAWSARRLYPRTSQHSYIIQLCDLLDYGEQGAMYIAGESPPERILLQYFSREDIRRATGVASKSPSECLLAEAQARKADSASTEKGSASTTE